MKKGKDDIVETCPHRARYIRVARDGLASFPPLLTGRAITAPAFVVPLPPPAASAAAPAASGRHGGARGDQE